MSSSDYIGRVKAGSLRVWGVQDGEDESELSEAVTVDLNELLAGVTFETAQEVALSAGQYAWQVGPPQSLQKRKRGSEVLSNSVLCNS